MGSSFYSIRRVVYTFLYERMVNYMFNKVSLTTIMRKHTPAILCSLGVVATVVQTMMSVKRDERYWKFMYEYTGCEYYKLRYLQMTKSNNWLRMHGYPMRRKNHH